MAERWIAWAADWLTKPGLARLKGRFAAGKASFTSATVASARSVPEKGRLYSHYRLSTGPVLRGNSGLAELRERYDKAGELIAALGCSFCRHEYVVAVERARDPLSLPSVPGSAAGYPASFSADWFRIWHPDCPGEPSLDCPHCEQRGRPEFRLL